MSKINHKMSKNLFCSPFKYYLSTYIWILIHNSNLTRIQVRKPASSEGSLSLSEYSEKPLNSPNFPGS
jgi:hypothetical protein